MSITAHCIVKNEECFVWYAIMSILDHVDRVIVFDTGSTDATLEIVKSIKSAKVEVHAKGPASKSRHTELRQEMLEMSETDWFLILDGDEIWPESQIEKLCQLAARPEAGNYQVICVDFIRVVGDLYHHIPEGGYTIKGKTGNLTTRLYNLKCSLKWVGDYDVDQVVDLERMKPVIENPDGIFLSDAYFIHTTHLERTRLPHDVWDRSGKSFDTYLSPGVSGISYDLPKVFFKDRPDIVPFVAARMSFLRALLNRFRRTARKYFKPVESTALND